MSFGLLDRDTTTTPGVSTPTITLSFGGGGGGGLAGLAPDIGPFGGSESLETGLLSLEISRGFAPFVDWADIVLRPPDGSGTAPALGETGSVGITLGAHDTTFSGTIDSLEHRADGTVRLGLGNGSRLLAQARHDASFAEMTAADIIAALCAEAGVDADVSGGATLPRYFADGGLSVLDHVARLAASMGRLARLSDDGVLTLTDDTSGGEEIALSAGDAILSAELTDRAAPAGVQITGAGASEWAWLRKDAGPLQATAGAAPQRSTPAAWLRDTAAVQTYAEARGRAVARDASPGHLVLAAYPNAQPGVILALSGTALDGAWRVMASTIRFDATEGFSNAVRVARAEDGAGALGLGLGGML